MRGWCALSLLGTIWLCALGAGEWWLVAYESTVGTPAAPAACWPADSAVPYTANVFNLVLFAHPHCPCTRATISELAVLMARCPSRISTKVLFAEPAPFTDDWARTDSWRAAAVIPGVANLYDRQGQEAQRFGAHTSGQVFLYDAHKKLRFQGGITSSRGHAGDNFGRQVIEDIVHTDTPAYAESSVFGCSLDDPVSEER